MKPITYTINNYERLDLIKLASSERYRIKEENIISLLRSRLGTLDKRFQYLENCIFDRFIERYWLPIITNKLPKDLFYSSSFNLDYLFQHGIYKPRPAERTWRLPNIYQLASLRAASSLGNEWQIPSGFMEIAYSHSHFSIENVDFLTSPSLVNYQVSYSFKSFKRYTERRRGRKGYGFRSLTELFTPHTAETFPWGYAYFLCLLVSDTGTPPVISAVS